MLLSDRNFRVLFCLWLLASEDKTLQGVLPSVEDVAFRLRMSEKDVSKSIQELSPFMEQDDIGVISSCNQVGPPETETETETYKEETEKSKKGSRFAPPSIEDIQILIDEKKYEYVDAEGFFHFYESKGWIVGKSKMKSWQSALGGWESRAKKEGKSKTSQKPLYQDFKAFE
jgi:hypothetical protein